ncbi:hypothetical protein NCCP2222_01710 [Sporosarcina sp. NCCP-2222]|nr:hypothetical protein NCCP2222_01710 [Sporosarcina sp. NCCP-2222]
MSYDVLADDEVLATYNEITARISEHKTLLYSGIGEFQRNQVKDNLEQLRNNRDKLVSQITKRDLVHQVINP